jgi:hypothetical protein
MMQRIYPDLTKYFHPHKLNFKIPTKETMEELLKERVVPKFPADYRRIPDWYRSYENPDMVLPDPSKFKFKVAERRKAGKRISGKVLEQLVRAGYSAQQVHKLEDEFENADDNGKEIILDEIDKILAAMEVKQAPKNKAPQRLQQILYA